MSSLTTKSSLDTLREQLAGICVAVAAPTVAALAEQISTLLGQFSFLELRLDNLPRPAEAFPLITGLLKEQPRAVLLATCRRKVAGGQFDGTAAEELAILSGAAHAGCQVVDLSIESAEELPPTAVDALRGAGAIVLLSFHDFSATGDLDATAQRMQAYQPDVLKVVPTANCLADNLPLLRFLETQSRRQQPFVVGMSMGEQGFPTRVLNLRAGSLFTFASATDAAVTAPGQVAAHTLASTFRVQSVGRSTRVYGVAGDPIRSSLSPLIHNMAFQKAEVDAVYLPLRTSDAEDLFRLARELPLDGLSITMPLKQAVIPLLDHVDPLASRIGAVNTIVRQADGLFWGFNTDVAGILTPLERRLSLRNASVLVLGAGGAARAAVFACQSRGARVSILNRTAATAEALANEAGAEAISREDAVRSRFDVVINATPAGMKTSTATLPIEVDDLQTGLVFDLVYNPIETPLLKRATERGIATIPGTEMFILQGARQFELWTGKQAPEQEIRDLVLKALTR